MTQGIIIVTTDDLESVNNSILPSMLQSAPFILEILVIIDSPLSNFDGSEVERSRPEEIRRQPARLIEAPMKPPHSTEHKKNLARPSRGVSIWAEVIAPFVMDYVDEWLPRLLWPSKLVPPQPSRLQVVRLDLLDPVDHSRLDGTEFDRHSKNYFKPLREEQL